MDAMAGLARVGYNFILFLLAHLYFVCKLEVVRVHAQDVTGVSVSTNTNLLQLCGFIMKTIYKKVKIK